MSFEEFQDGLCGDHHGYQNGRILAILNLCVIVMLPIKFSLKPTYGRRCCLGGYLGYQNGMILAILNLHVALMPPTKFGLNLT